MIISQAKLHNYLILGLCIASDWVGIGFFLLLLQFFFFFGLKAYVRSLGNSIGFVDGIGEITYGICVKQ